VNKIVKPVIRILLIEDDEDDALLTREYLEEIDTYKFEVTWEPNLSKAKKAMLGGDYGIFLVDYRLGSESGLQLIEFAHSKGVLTPAIVLTGQGDLEIDLIASRMGAADYLVKSELNSSILERTIRYALSQAQIIKELNEKEKKYRLLFERSIDPIFLATEKFAIMDVNYSFLKFFGYSPAEASNITLESIFANPEDFEHFKLVLKEVEQIKDFEVTLIAKSGEKKVCFLNCVFIPDQASEFCCYQGIVHDLTMRKQAEQDMLIAERLSLTGKIARTIAHEVRNPLTNLNLALDQLRSEMPEGNESVKLYGEIIERNAHRIEQLVGEMLNSSRPKELHLELYPIHEILDTTLDLAIDRIKLRQIKLVKRYASDMPRILVDIEKIKIAILNIVINGVEAMEPEKGVLTVTSSLKGNILTIEISDNGKGISPVDIKKLFDPFFTDKQSGMGLGLTSTKNILNSHNAEIEVTSQMGAGTTFLLHFKLAI
jgi:PAS domain S-box-containing protein